MITGTSPRRHREVIDALRRGTVPVNGLDPLDGWLFTLESDAVAADATLAGASDAALTVAVDRLLESRLAAVSSKTPAFAQVLRGYRAASLSGDSPTADGLAAWVGGQPHVAASAKRAAGIRGDLDHFGAMAFLQGLDPCRDC